MTGWRPRVAGALGELALFVAWGFVLLVPVTARLGERAVGGGDARYWLWQGWRLAELVRDGHPPTWIPDVIWPYGSDLQLADGALPSLVGMAWNLVASPVVAYNLAVVTALVTSAVAARHLASLFTTRRAVMIVVGLAFAAAPALTMRLEGHFNLLFAFPAPLLVAMSVRVVRGEERVPPLRLGLLLAVAYVSSGYYFFFGALAVGVAVLVARQDWRRRGDSLIRLAVAAVVAAVVLSPLIVPRLRLEERERAAGAPQLSDGAEVFSADLWSAFLPPPGQLVEVEDLSEFHRRFGGNGVEQTTFPGLLLLLGVAGLVVVRSEVRRPLLGAAAALWLASLGPTTRLGGDVPLSGVEWLPMAALLELPGMSGVRAPNRASFVLAAVAAACFAFALGWAVERLRPRGRTLLLVGCVALLVAGVRAPVGWSPSLPGEPVEAALRSARRDAAPNDTVIHLPDDCLFNANQIELQMLHRQPVVGCQGFDAAIPWKTGLPAYFSSKGWAALRCDAGVVGGRPVDLSTTDTRPRPEAVGLLRAELKVRFVVFDRANQCRERGGEIMAALSSVGRSIGDDGRLVVFDLAP